MGDRLVLSSTTIAAQSTAHPIVRQAIVSVELQFDSPEENPKRRTTNPTMRRNRPRKSNSARSSRAEGGVWGFSLRK